MKTTDDLQRTLPWKDNIGYSMGNLGSNLIFAMITFHMLYFYTDIMGISAAAVGVLFLVARIWDAVNDPIMGSIVDKTHTRWGKFRPFIIVGIVPCAIVYTLTFYTPDLGHTGKVIWAFATYIPLGMIVTSINIPYHAQTTIMSKNPIERTEIGTVSNITALLATLVVAAATLPLIGLFATPQAGFTWITALYGTLMIACYTITFIVTKRYDLPASEKPLERTAANFFTLKQKIRVLTQNRPLIALMFGYLFFQIGTSITASTAIYFFKYYLRMESLYPPFMGLFLIMMTTGMLIVPKLSKKMGKKKLFQISNLLATFSLLAPIVIFPFIRANDTKQLIFLGGLAGIVVLFGAFWNGPVVALVWGMIPDTVEYAELKVGIRSEGLIFALLSFMMKAGLALGGAITGAVLMMIDYVPNQVQNEKTLFGLLILCSLLPFVIRLMTNMVMKYYTLSEGEFQRIVVKLEEQRTLAN
ncbi:glycoside-pentoside-hexuronide (GPH):cation symporter [bacterium]|nr:glycoside-pentoside-hexuronide (GPH):cation symporter [bacterium]